MEISPIKDKVILRTTLQIKKEQIGEILHKTLPKVIFKQIERLDRKTFLVQFAQSVDLIKIEGAFLKQVSVESLNYLYNTVDGLELGPTNEMVMRPLKGKNLIELNFLEMK